SSLAVSPRTGSGNSLLSRSRGNRHGRLGGNSLGGGGQHCERKNSTQWGGSEGKVSRKLAEVLKTGYLTPLQDLPQSEGTVLREKHLSRWRNAGAGDSVYFGPVPRAANPKRSNDLGTLLQKEYSKMKRELKARRVLGSALLAMALSLGVGNLQAQEGRKVLSNPVPAYPD